jgi:hypothetical protein
LCVAPQCLRNRKRLVRLISRTFTLTAQAECLTVTALILPLTESRLWLDFTYVKSIVHCKGKENRVQSELYRLYRSPDVIRNTEAAKDIQNMGNIEIRRTMDSKFKEMRRVGESNPRWMQWRTQNFFSGWFNKFS